MFAKKYALDTSKALIELENSRMSNNFFSVAYYFYDLIVNSSIKEIVIQCIAHPA